MSQQCLRTSSPGRSVPATPGFRSASSVPLERDRRCPYQLRTSGSTAPARFGKGCIGSETSDNRRHFGVRAIQLQMKLRDRERPSAPRQISPNRPGEIIVRESEEPARLYSETSQKNYLIPFSTLTSKECCSRYRKRSR